VRLRRQSWQIPRVDSSCVFTLAFFQRAPVGGSIKGLSFDSLARAAHCAEESRFFLRGSALIIGRLGYRNDDFALSGPFSPFSPTFYPLFLHVPHTPPRTLGVACTATYNGNSCQLILPFLNCGFSTQSLTVHPTVL
jgi:hypothetical protein